jgi:hypothetical protein
MTIRRTSTWAIVQNGSFAMPLHFDTLQRASGKNHGDIILDAWFARIALPFRAAWPRASHEAPASEVTSR